MLLYACAGLQFVRFYARSTDFYLRLPAYLSGHERLPFQERVLPIFLLKPIYASPWLMHRLSHANGVIPWSRAPFFLVSLVAFAVAAVFTQLLYRAVSPRRSLSMFVFPFFLFTVMWTYTIHVEANYSYPYDMISLAFFTVGLVCVYTRRFLPLLLTVAVGTWNRETTLFLAGIFVLDAVSRNPEADAPLQERFDWRRIPWLRAGLLCAVWLAIKLWLSYHFNGNDESENYIRIAENAGRLKIRLVPALLNICGYLFPIVLLFWRRIEPVRFGNYIWIVVPWFAIMFYTGVILETRIYGELCPYTAVCIILLAERLADRSTNPQHVHASGLVSKVAA
ncbi:hypothetical protein GCM10022270_14930 [Terriglobus aquaticus]